MAQKDTPHSIASQASQQEIEQEETLHLAQTTTRIERALGRAAQVVDTIDDTYRETQRSMVESRGELSPEDIKLARLDLAVIDRNGALASSSKARLEKLLESPYFARVDFVEEETRPCMGQEDAPDGALCQSDAPACAKGTHLMAHCWGGWGACAKGTHLMARHRNAARPPTSQWRAIRCVPLAHAGVSLWHTPPEESSRRAAFTAYIGRFAFSDQGELVISDWRSPIAGLFYDFEPGSATYEAPAGPVRGELTRKRQIRIEDGRLIYAVDSETGVRDEVLQRELSHASSAQMRTIVASIQREQNAIIRDEEQGTLVIQGVAGSGKTSIALHRIAYLLYRQKGDLTSQSVVVLSPNSVFGDYISGVLPELGEEPIQEHTLFDLAVQLLHGVAKVQPPRSFVDDTDEKWRIRARAKSTREFEEAVSAYLADVPRTLFSPDDLQICGKTFTSDWLRDRWNRYGALAVRERLDLVAGDVLVSAPSTWFGRTLQVAPSRRDLARQLSQGLRAKTPLALYRQFFKDTGQTSLFRAPAAGAVEWEDACPLILFCEVFGGVEAHRDVKHLVLDEMQDLSPVQHRVVQMLFPCDKTILGDCNQLIDDREGLSLEQVAGLYPGARTVSLMRSYRSTFEITQLAARIKPVAGLQAVKRHGPAPQIIQCANTRDVLERIDQAIRAFREGDGRTLGIIHKSQDLMRRYAELLACRHEINFITEDSSEFLDGITACSIKMAKGLEFDEVVLLDVDSAQYATPADRNLLYVGITRAMHRLILLHRGAPSPFLATP